MDVLMITGFHGVKLSHCCDTSWIW